MHLVLTLDYEVFGKGSGDVFEHMILPTRKLLEICERTNIRVSIFFEVIEYLKIKKEWDSGNRMGYTENPVEAIENQLKDAYLAGHDIQMHLHPQWLNARYEDGWKVDENYWRLPLVNREGCGCSIEELIRKGKETIENIIKSVNRDYKCRALRAADFNIYPSEEICAAMRSTGMEADSSVVPGAIMDDGYSLFDYSGIPRTLPYWYVNSDDLMEADARFMQDVSLIEMPVFTLPVTRLRKFDSQRIRVKMANMNYALQRLKQKTGTKSYFDKIRYYLGRESVIWDFCLFSYGKMKQYYRGAERIVENSDYRFHPVVLVGHSKEFINAAPFGKFIRFASRSGSEFITISEVLEKARK